MKKIVYSEKEFDSSMLPSSRKAQFKDICRHSYRLLLSFGLIMLAFAIPYIVSYIFRIIANVGMSSLLTKREVEGQEMAMSLIWLTMLFDFINIPCYIVFAIGLSGYSLIFRNLIFGDGVLYWLDFKKGIKDQGKYYVIAASIFGIFKLIVNFLCNYSTLVSNTFLNIFAGILIVLFYLLIVPSLFYFVVNHTLYEMKIFFGFSNAIRVTLSTLFVSSLFGLSLYFVKYVNLLPFPYLKILIIMCLIALIFPFFHLVFLLFSISSYDRLINEKYHKSIYHKGLSTYEYTDFDKE